MENEETIKKLIHLFETGAIDKQTLSNGINALKPFVAWSVKFHLMNAER